jgi:hypothetical protein
MQLARACWASHALKEEPADSDCDADVDDAVCFV